MTMQVILYHLCHWLVASDRSHTHSKVEGGDSQKGMDTGGRALWIHLRLLPITDAKQESSRKVEITTAQSQAEAIGLSGRELTRGMSGTSSALRWLTMAWCMKEKPAQAQVDTTQCSSPTLTDVIKGRGANVLPKENCRDRRCK